MKLFDKETIIIKTRNVGWSSPLNSFDIYKRYKYFPWLKAHRVCQIIGHNELKMNYSGDGTSGGVIEFMSCKRCGLHPVKW